MIIFYYEWPRHSVQCVCIFFHLLLYTVYELVEVNCQWHCEGNMNVSHYDTLLEY